MKRRYAYLMSGLSLVAPLWLKHRARKGKEDPNRLTERYGKTKHPRPEGQLIWMHGASVGETTMMLPLIDRLLAADPARRVLVTSGTVTSAELMAKRLPDRAFHQYIPFDAPHYVNRFLAHWRPDLAIWAESEIWPNLVLQTKAANIPMALINARMSEKSLLGWAKRKRFAETVFACFDLILPADKKTAIGLSALLNKTIAPVGNLKYDAPTLSFSAQTRDALKNTLGQRPIWVAASLHTQEIIPIIEAHKNIEACLILVPRHPSEAASRMIVADHPHLNFARRSKNETPDASTDIYLFDTLGEMGLAYSLGEIAFVGGSLSPELMGHNPLEPIRLSIPTLTGPHFESFSEVYAPYLKEKAVVNIEDVSQLSHIIEDMLNTPKQGQEMTRLASAILKDASGSLDVTLNALEALL